MHPAPTTIDEVQYAPQLFGQLKLAVDKTKQHSMYWLTGSQKFHLMQDITETLAGRVAIIDLLGFSQAEDEWLANAKAAAGQPKQLMDIYRQIWLGAYLTGWSSPQILEASAMSGAILETWMLAEILKSYWHNGLEARFHFYRDRDRREVDLLIERDNQIHPVEFKKTASPSRSAAGSFSALAKLDKPLGPGAVICLKETAARLAKDIGAIPARLL